MNKSLFLKKHGTTILTTISIAGVGVTAYLTAKATPKYVAAIAEMEECRDGEDESVGLTKKETFKTAVCAYKFAIIAGGVTIASIALAQHLNTKRISALTAGLVGLGYTFREYKNKLKVENPDLYEKIESMLEYPGAKALNVKHVEPEQKGDDILTVVDSFSGLTMYVDKEVFDEKIAELEKHFQDDGMLAWCDISFILTGKTDAYDSSIGELCGWSKEQINQYYDIPCEEQVFSIVAEPIVINDDTIYKLHYYITGTGRISGISDTFECDPVWGYYEY